MMIEREMWVVSHTGFRHGPFPRSEAVAFLSKHGHSHMRAASPRPRISSVTGMEIRYVPPGLFEGPPPRRLRADASRVAMGIR